MSYWSNGQAFIGIYSNYNFHFVVRYTFEKCGDISSERRIGRWIKATSCKLVIVVLCMVPHLVGFLVQSHFVI